MWTPQPFVSNGDGETIHNGGQGERNPTDRVGTTKQLFATRDTPTHEETHLGG